MNKPRTLTDWTESLLRELVELSVFENEWLEMKTDINPRDAGERLRIARTVCGLANADGGFIVFGVSDRANRGERLVGIDSKRDFPREFGDHFRTILSPSVAYDFLNPPLPLDDGKRVIHVVHVPRSDWGPHALVQNEKLEFPLRTPKGNDFMNYYAVRNAFLGYYQRRELLKLLVFELWTNLGRLEAMKVAEGEKDAAYSLVTLETEMIQRLIADTFSLVADEPEILNALYTIREQASLINRRSEIFFREISLPRTNLSTLVREHNEFVFQKTARLAPVFVEAINRLSARFQLQNPLEGGLGAVKTKTEG